MNFGFSGRLLREVIVDLDFVLLFGKLEREEFRCGWRRFCVKFRIIVMREK